MLYAQQTNSRPYSKILLVYPETPQDSYWSFSHSLKMINKKVSMPPLGVLTIAAMLPRDEFQTRVIDMNAEPLTDSDIQWADAVFFSAMIVQKDSLEQSIKRVGEFGKTIVSGGPYTSTAYRETSGVDCFFIGEAESCWDVFLDDLRAGRLKKAYAAPFREIEYQAVLDYFGPGSHVVKSDAYPDINTPAVPRFDLIDLDLYSVMPVQASRGCPIGCEFCDIWRRFGRTSRNKTSGRLRAELDELYRLGWRDSVFLVDDNFIGNRKRATELLEALVAWQEEHDYAFTFLTETTLSLADDDILLSLMARAGFSQVFVGIETPCEESLKETRKYINTIGSIADKVAKIQAAGIQLMSGFIIGFDSDPDDIAARMTKCIQELGIPQAMIGVLNALPETDLYDRLKEEGRIICETSGNNTHGFGMNFRTARPESAVLADYKRVLEAAYPRDMKNYFARCSVLRSRWPRNRVSAGKLPMSWKLNAVKNCLITMAGSPYRFSAFRFLLETLLLKPSFLEEAVTLCVKGHHLWVITGRSFEVEEMRNLMDGRLTEFTDFLRSRRAALGGVMETLWQALPDLRSADPQDLLARAKSALSGRKDLRGCYEKLSLTVREIEAYRRRIQSETEAEYRRLSVDGRAKLQSELDRFLNEANALYRNFCAEPIPVKVRDK